MLLFTQRCLHLLQFTSNIVQIKFALVNNFSLSSSGANLEKPSVIIRNALRIKTDRSSCHSLINHSFGYVYWESGIMSLKVYFN